MTQTEREDLPFDPALDPARDPDNETPDGGVYDPAEPQTNPDEPQE